MRTKLLALLAGSAIALTATAPAHAATWTGDPFSFGYGTDWDLSNWYMDDADFGSSAGPLEASFSGEYTDTWDTALQLDVTSATLDLLDQTYECDNDSDIDIAEVDGDVDITCTTDWSAPNDADVHIRGAIHISGPDGDLVRYTLEITNNSGAAIDDFVVGTYTDWGSSDSEGLWAYQNYDATVLTAPADEDNNNSADIEETGSDWLVHYEADDAPGSLAWGNAGGDIDVFLAETEGDYYWTETPEFTVADGETVYLAYYTGWNPALLHTLGYTNSYDVDVQPVAADALAADAVEFDSFSGRLIAGLPAGANVINWGPIPEDEVLEPEAEDLAATGADTSSLWAGLGLLIAGVAVVAVRRRSRA